MKFTLPLEQPGCIRLTIGLFIASLFSFSPAQLEAQKYYTAETSYAVKLGRTKPIFEFAYVAQTDADKLKDRKENKPRIIPNFGGRRPLTTHNPDALPQGFDPLFDPSMTRAPMNEILPIVNIEGIDEEDSGSTPPDVNGDISRDNYVEIVNSTYFKVYDKNGQAVSGLFNVNSIWSQVQHSSAGDPILLYDQEVDRWLLTEFAADGNRVLVAISLTSDPRGSWDAYVFQTPRFPDYPKYGIWGDAYYLTTNESGPNFPVYAINRDDILAGVDTPRIQRLTVPKIGGVFFEVGQPLDWDGVLPPPDGSPGIVVKLNDDDWNTTVMDEILLHKITIDWNNSNASNIEIISIPPTPFDSDGCLLDGTGGFACVPQPNGQGLDGIPWTVFNKAQYRNFGTHESFVMCFMVDVTGGDVAGIRWIEFRKTTTEDWHIYQEGTVGADDGIHRFMPSIGIDGRGNIGLGYSVSGYDKFPSLRYTGRYSTDPLGTMTFQEYEFVAGGGSQGFDRFGDYASMSVDPADDETFWFAGEYLLPGGDWSTRIVSFRALHDTIDIFPITLTSPIENEILGEEAVIVTILNRGLTTVFDFPLGYQFNNGPWIMESPGLDSLPINQEFSYTFLAPVNFEAPGVYPLRIATFLDSDHNKMNDTLTFMVTKYAFRDVVLEYSVSEENEPICSDQVHHTVLIKNNGFDTVTSIELMLHINGSPVQSIPWTGSLAFGEQVPFSFITHHAENGNFDFFLTVVHVNQGNDEIVSNNELEWSLEVQADGHQVFLEFTTDNFPSESSWKLFDDSNNLIGSGGPFAEPQHVYTDAFCLDPEACYSFTVYDSYGDGMSSQGVEGYFVLLNESGEMLAELTQPKFGNQFTSQFCLTAECLFSVQVGVVHESYPGAADGMAIVNIANGLGTMQFSLDGGQTFQTSNTFLSLSPGIYNLLAQDGAGCMDTASFEILSCNLQTLITTKPASGGDVGEIHIAVSGNIGPVQYSIQGGAFVSDSFFVMLEPGDYIVTVKDSAGCEATDTVQVSTEVSTAYVAGDYFVDISPNPGRGVYQVAASFPVNDIFIHYTLHTADGDPFLTGTLVRYNALYKGEISLTAYPAGLYYISFRAGLHLEVRRMIKIE